MPKPLVPVRLPVPGSWGLNTQRKADLLPAQWATEATNCVFDDAGRLASRNGTQDQTSTIAGTPDVKGIHEYIDSAGAKLQIYAAGNVIYKLVGATSTDISGTITTPTDDDWKFVNFNGKCVGFQSGHAPIVLSSVGGTFADIALAGTNQPTTAASEVLAAYGRLWVIDGTDLKYSDSLDETNWNNLFDLTTVWLSGIDVGVALADFNGYLTVFGKNSIIVYSNPWSPTGGGSIDTTTMELVENIGGIGCISRDTVAPIGNDIIFLSRQGVRSLGRTIQEKSMPITSISKNVDDELIRLVNNEAEADIKAVFVPSEGSYILSLPVADKTYYFDLRSPLQDGSFRCALWDRSFTDLYVNDNQYLLLGVAGNIQRYTGYLDNVASDGTGGSTYLFDFVSGWSDMSEIDPQLGSLGKIPKRGKFLMLGGSGQIVTLKWAFDFYDTFTTFQDSLPSSSSAEWGESEWNVDEWSGGLIFNEVKAPMRRTGQVLKFGVSLDINGEAVALQLLDMLLKTGRIK